MADFPTLAEQVSGSETDSDCEYADTVDNVPALSLKVTQSRLGGHASLTAQREEASWLVRAHSATGAIYYEGEMSQETSYVEPDRVSELQDLQDDMQEERLRELIGYHDAPGGIDNPHFRSDEIILARQRLIQWIARENVSPPKFVTEIKLRWYVCASARARLHAASLRLAVRLVVASLSACERFVRAMAIHYLPCRPLLESGRCPRPRCACS
jgi:hypothetical protein